MKLLVQVRVVGYNLDQLINKIQNNNITIYNIKRVENNVMFFTIKLKQYKRLKPILKNYEYQSKYLGIANFKTWLKRNVAILLVLPFAFGLMMFSTNITWNIKVYGADTELKQSVVDILKVNNISKGKILPKDNKFIEKILTEQLPNVAQVSCMLRGTTIVINISKKLVYVPETYEPIKASFSGIITSFSLISGTLAVNVGDFVNVGDILVYPFSLDKDLNQVSVQPIAEIKAKVYIVGSSKLSATETVLARTGKSYTTSSITLLNKKLFSKKSSKPFALYESYVYNENISSVLPLKRVKVTYYQLDYMLVNYDLVAEKGRIEQESVDLAYLNLPTNSEILDEKTTSLVINDTLYSTTTLTISTIIS